MANLNFHPGHTELTPEKPRQYLRLQASLTRRRISLTRNIASEVGHPPKLWTPRPSLISTANPRVHNPRSLWDEHWGIGRHPKDIAAHRRRKGTAYICESIGLPREVSAWVKMGSGGGRRPSGSSSITFEAPKAGISDERRPEVHFHKPSATFPKWKAPERPRLAGESSRKI